MTPLPERDWEGITENPLIGEQLNYDRGHQQHLAREQLAQLNPEPSNAHKQIISSVEAQAGQIFFLNGPGGTGCQGAVLMAAKFEVFPTLSLKTFTHFYFSP